MVEKQTLDPYIPGSFMDAWLQWCQARSPDFFYSKLHVWKILGSIFLNTAFKVVMCHEPFISGNGIIGLIGPPGSIKSWAIRTVKLALPTVKDRVLMYIPSGTPEFMVLEIWKNSWGFFTLPEIASVMEQARTGGYMGNWGNELCKIYDLDVLEHGRKKSQSVIVNQYSYYVSVITGGLPEDYLGMFHKWPGLKRRRLRRDMGEPAPRKIWDFETKGAEALAKIHSLVLKAKNKAVLIHFKNYRELDRKIAELTKTKDPNLSRLLYEYAYKMLFAYLIDKYVASSLITPSETGAPSNKLSDRESGGRGMEREGVEFFWEKTDDLLSYSPTHPIGSDTLHAVSISVSRLQELYSNLGVETVGILSIDLSKMASDIFPTVSLLIGAPDRSSTGSSTLPDTLLTVLSAPTTKESQAYARFALQVSSFIKRRGGKTTLREICRYLKWTKDEALKYLKTMKTAGEIEFVYGPRKSIKVVSPTYRCCLNCKHLVFDYEEKVYNCLKGHDLVGEMKMDLTKSCKDFEPRGGEE